MKVVRYAFDKWFNYGEANCAKLTGEIRAEEKIDGSLISLWYDKNKWNISTNGMIDATDAEIQLKTEEIKNYKDLFLKALSKYDIDFNLLDKTYCYTFELVSPLNRIVIPYNETDIFLIGVRDLWALKEIKPDSLLYQPFKRPELYDIKTPEQAIEIAKTLGANKEGFVLVDDKFNRVKVKGTEYLAKHLLRNNTLSTKRFVEIILKNEQDDLIAFFPEYKNIIKSLEDKVNAYISSVEKAIAETDFSQDRKSFALEVKNNEHSAILFKLYGDREYDWKRRTVNISNINKIMSLIGA